MAALSSVGEATVMASSPITVDVPPEPSLPPRPEPTAGSTLPTPLIAAGPRRPARSASGAGLVAALTIGVVLIAGVVLAALFVGSPEDEIRAPVPADLQQSARASGLPEGVEVKPQEVPAVDERHAAASHAEKVAELVEGEDAAMQELPSGNVGVVADARDVEALPNDAQAAEVEATSESKPSRKNSPKSPAKAAERQLANRISRSCADWIFEKKAIVVSVPKSGAASINISPNPYAKLQSCIARNLNGLATGTYKFTVER